MAAPIAYHVNRQGFMNFAQRLILVTYIAVIAIGGIGWVKRSASWEFHRIPNAPFFVAFSRDTGETHFISPGDAKDVRVPLDRPDPWMLTKLDNLYPIWTIIVIQPVLIYSGYFIYTRRKRQA